jgi:hypothetical protein
MRLPQLSSDSFALPVVSITLLLLLSTLTVPVRAATTQQLQCSSTLVRFGTVPVGQSESQFIALTNTGQTTATISAINATNAEFSSSGLTLPAELAAGESMNISVIFTPTATGWVGGTITIASNASNPNLRFGIAGTGVSSDYLTATPATLSFGQVPVGTSAAISVVLTNARSWRETLQAIQVNGTGFSVSGPAAPLILPVGQSITLNVTFAPQEAGPTGGSIFIVGPALNIPLTGTGGTSIGQLTVNPSSVNFGNVNVGSTATQPTTLNATGGSVTISSASSSNSGFALPGVSFPLTLSAGQSVALNVAFSPTAGGNASATLSFTSNASNGPTAESLAGVGVVPQYSVNLSWTAASSVVGYNVYRGTTAGSYSKINTTLDSNTMYTDSSVSSGVTYYYAATSVNSSGQESGYSSPTEVTIP